MDELDFYNPYDDELDDDEEDDFELVEVEAPKRRRKKRKNPEPAIAVATPVLLLGLGYVAWCWYNQTKTGLWNWAPWKTLGRRRLLKAPNTTEAERQARQQVDLDRATEAMMAPAFSVQEVDLWRRPRHNALEKEIVSFIVP